MSESVVSRCRGVHMSECACRFTYKPRSLDIGMTDTPAVDNKPHHTHTWRTCMTPSWQRNGGPSVSGAGACRPSDCASKTVGCSVFYRITVKKGRPVFEQCISTKENLTTKDKIAMYWSGCSIHITTLVM